MLGEALEAYEGGALVNGQRVSDLRFADDIDLMGETASDAQAILEATNQSTKKYGLEISREKR